MMIKKLVLSFILILISKLFIVGSAFGMYTHSYRFNEVGSGEIAVRYSSQKDYISFKIKNNMKSSANYSNGFGLYKIIGSGDYISFKNKDISNISDYNLNYLGSIDNASSGEMIMNIMDLNISIGENNYLFCGTSMLSKLNSDNQFNYCGEIIHIYFDDNKNEITKDIYEKQEAERIKKQQQFEVGYIDSFTKIFEYRKQKFPGFGHIYDISGVNQFIENQYLLSGLDYRTIAMNLRNYDRNDLTNGLEEFTTYVKSYIALYERNKKQREQENKAKEEQAKIDEAKKLEDLKSSQITLNKSEYQQMESEYKQLKQDKQFEDSMKEKSGKLLEVVNAKSQIISGTNLLRYIDNCIEQVNALKQLYPTKIEIIDRLVVSLKLRKLEVYEGIEGK